MNKKKDGKQRKLLIVILILIIISVFTGVSTYSWFIYNKVVSATVQGSVQSWSFSLNDSNDIDYVIPVKANLYPGMKQYDNSAYPIKLTNQGGMTADISLYVKKIIIYGTTYEIGGTVGTETFTKEKLQNFIDTLPFDISYSLVLSDGTSAASTTLAPGDSVNVSITINWDYVSSSTTDFEAKNKLDTEYGEKAYDFYKANGSDAVAIEITLAIDAEETTPTS